MPALRLRAWVWVCMATVRLAGCGGSWKEERKEREGGAGLQQPRRSAIFRKKTCINVDGLEWLRPKWKGLGSIYFKWASKMATLFYDQIINDSDEMRKVYLNLFKTNPFFTSRIYSIFNRII